MISELSYHAAKQTLLDAIASLVTPSPDGPIRRVHKGHFSLLEAENQTLFVWFAGAEENATSANELMLPGSFMFSVAGVAQKVPLTFQGSGGEDAERLASETFSAWYEAFIESPDLGVDDVTSAQVVSITASDADQYGNLYLDAQNVPLWVEGGTIRVNLL